MSRNLLIPLFLQLNTTNCYRKPSVQHEASYHGITYHTHGLLHGSYHKKLPAATVGMGLSAAGHMVSYLLHYLYTSTRSVILNIEYLRSLKECYFFNETIYFQQTLSNSTYPLKVAQVLKFDQYMAITFRCQ